MNLRRKTKLASDTLKVGKKKIVFNIEKLDEIKEAITKQDIRDLKESGAISIKEPKGRKKQVKRKTRRRVGKVKIRVKTRKQDYVKMTRKLRAYLKELKKQERLSQNVIIDARKKIRNKFYKSKRHLKQELEGFMLEVTPKKSIKKIDSKNKIKTSRKNAENTKKA
ncbi:MAG: 50S ribosomal protein L19e [Nanoarchaeota archaeon]|nr:50S ribosomal protein L19e [Nanoarchaeota archaeon]